MQYFIWSLGYKQHILILLNQAEIHLLSWNLCGKDGTEGKDTGGKVRQH